MNLLESIVGGFAAALFTLLAAELQKFLTERDTAVVALGAELAHNLSVARDVLEKNAVLIHHTGESQWWELVAFSESSWQAVVISGSLSRLKPEVIGPLARAYAELGKANYSAEKLQSGRVDTMKARQYTVRVFDAGEAASKALQAFEGNPKYKKLLERFEQSREALGKWEEKAVGWRQEVAAARI